jgi:hypothetical protein
MRLRLIFLLALSLAPLTGTEAEDYELARGTGTHEPSQVADYSAWDYEEMFAAAVANSCFPNWLQELYEAKYEGLPLPDFTYLARCLLLGEKENLVVFTSADTFTAAPKVWRRYGRAGVGRGR